MLACLWSAPAPADFNNGVYAYSRGEYARAYHTMRSLAEASDHALAQYYLAMMYLRGQGVEQNYEEAAKWFRQAAEQRIKQAQYQLAKLYMAGRGVPRDYEYAYAWYRAGAEHQHQGAMAELQKARDSLAPEELEEAEKLSRQFLRKYGPLPADQQPGNAPNQPQ